MKTLVVYTSQTGFTKKYAEWISEEIHADILKLDEAKKKKTDYFESYDAVIYGGWAMAGNIVQSKWFLEKAPAWKDKKLVMFCVGASPETNPDVEVALHNSAIGDGDFWLFYCPQWFQWDPYNVS